MEEDLSTNATESDSTHLNTTKKRKIMGRMRDVRKKLLSSTHETGSPCNCARLKCFDTLDASKRKYIIDRYNSLTATSHSYSYLAGLVVVLPVANRRPRQPEETAKLNQCSYSYRVRVKKGNLIEEVPVCFKAFCSLHGISKKKVEVIQNYLKKGGSTDDGRGKHADIKHKKSTETYDLVFAHISSFKDKGDYGHYTLKDSKETYLPPELSISKLYDLYKVKFPHNIVSYKYYRTILKKKIQH